MTVSNTSSRGDYVENGVTTQFSIPFYFLDPTHVLVIGTLAGVSATLVLGSDYTVAGTGVAGGGTLTILTPTNGRALAVLRNVPYTQLTHYVENDPFPAASHEAALDLLTMQNQQQQEIMGRAATLPSGVTSISGVPAPVSGSVLGWVSGTWAWLSGASVTLAANLLTAAGGMGTSLINYLAPLTNAVGRLLVAKLAERVSVMDFGAVGDGVTDDTAAIQNAINACKGSASWGTTKRLFFPTGTYLVSNLVIPDFSFLEGAGRGSVIIAKNAGDATYLAASTSWAYDLVVNATYNPTGAALTSINNPFIIRNLVLNANSLKSNCLVIRAWDILLEGSDVFGATVCDCLITTPGRNATASAGTMVNGRISRCYFGNSSGQGGVAIPDYNIKVVDPPANKATDWMLDHCYLAKCNVYNIYTQHTTVGWIITHNHCYLTGGAGQSAFFTKADYLTIISDNYFENDVHIGGSTSGAGGLGSVVTFGPGNQLLMGSLYCDFGNNGAFILSTGNAYKTGKIVHNYNDTSKMAISQGDNFNTAAPFTGTASGWIKVINSFNAATGILMNGTFQGTPANDGLVDAGASGNQTAHPTWVVKKQISATNAFTMSLTVPKAAYNNAFFTGRLRISANANTAGAASVFYAQDFQLVKYAGGYYPQAINTTYTAGHFSAAPAIAAVEAGAFVTVTVTATFANVLANTAYGGGSLELI